MTLYTFNIINMFTVKIIQCYYSCLEREIEISKICQNIYPLTPLRTFYISMI